MTAAEPENVPARTPDHPSTADSPVAPLDHLAERLGGRASVKAVYGEPVIADGVTVVPVAEVGFGFGFGAGRKFGDAEAAKTAEGKGGGGGAGARPLGYLEIRDGTVTYKPIRSPWRDLILPLAALVIVNALPKAVRALRRRRGHRA
ncbi:spore germination protein GerW family protein [Streptomyces sp. BBFR115]|uniref:spore germination protein GerW family protein n=1 Tax=Streptomyces sp. BBFR115 TaxID=3448173 RepID=UPI003F76692F